MMMTDADYDVLTEADEPDVAFLAGTDNLEIRTPSGARKKSAGAVPRPRRPSRFCSSVLWIVLLSSLVGCLVIALGVILYRRSQAELASHAFANGSVGTGSSASGRPAATSTSASDGWAGPSVKNSTDLENCDSQKKRLLDFVKPQVYTLNMTLLNVTEGEYFGIVKIQFVVLKATKIFTLHVRNLLIGNQNVHLTMQSEGGEGEGGGGERVILLDGVHFCVPLEQLQISTKKLLTPGVEYVLKVQFTGSLRDNMHGFYRSSYVDASGKKIFLATTQFEDTHARAAFPCFDEPAMKAVFRVQLTHESSLLALSNMPVKSKTPYRQKGLTVTEFEETPVMSTYLVAFILCDFEKKTSKTSSKNDSVEVSVYAARHKLNQTDFALQTAVSVLKFYESFFGIKYPLKKLDLIAIPDFSAGAMENWGLITYREHVLLYDAEESSLTQQDYITIVIAHEIAHQWFGNLVTMSWWDDLWLNEGFATFTSYLGAESAQPQLTSWERVTTDNVQRALVSDALTNTHAIVLEVEDTADIASRFDPISYQKGASILLMLYEFLGESVFKTGVSHYLKRHTFSNAKTQDLWVALDAAWHSSGKKAATARSVSEIADSWIKKPGFPMLTAARKAGDVDVVQTKLVPMAERESKGDTWIVPISLLDSSGRNASQYLLDGRSMAVQLSTPEVSWYKLNARQTGFFRTAYDRANWDALTATLKNSPDVFLPEDRAHLLDDAFSLSRAGKLNMTIVLNLTSYLSKEKHYLPWSSAVPYLDSTEGLLFETESFGKFRRWRRKLVEPLFKSLDCVHVPNNNILQRRLCVHLFDEACHVELPECIEQAKLMYSQLTEKGIKVPVDIRSVVYQTVVRLGDEEVWEQLWRRQNQTQVASEKQLILSALSTTQKPWLIERYLRYAFDTKVVRPADTVSILSTLSMNYAGRGAVWRTVRQRWEEIVTRYGSDSTISSVFSTLDWMTSLQDLKEVRSFFNEKKLGAGALAFRQTLEIVELRRKFLDLYSSDIAVWLSE